MPAMPLALDQLCSLLELSAAVRVTQTCREVALVPRSYADHVRGAVTRIGPGGPRLESTDLPLYVMRDRDRGMGKYEERGRSAYWLVAIAAGLGVWLTAGEGTGGSWYTLAWCEDTLEGGSWSRDDVAHVCGQGAVEYALLRLSLLLLTCYANVQVGLGRGICCS